MLTGNSVYRKIFFAFKLWESVKKLQYMCGRLDSVRLPVLDFHKFTFLFKFNKLNVRTVQNCLEDIAFRNVKVKWYNSSELSMGWVDPWVGLGWVGNGSRIFVFSGLGWVMGLKWQICRVHNCIVKQLFCFVKTCRSLVHHCIFSIRWGLRAGLI